MQVLIPSSPQMTFRYLLELRTMTAAQTEQTCRRMNAELVCAALDWLMMAKCLMMVQCIMMAKCIMMLNDGCRLFTVVITFEHNPK